MGPVIISNMIAYSHKHWFFADISDYFLGEWTSAVSDDNIAHVVHVWTKHGLDSFHPMRICAKFSIEKFTIWQSSKLIFVVLEH